MTARFCQIPKLIVLPMAGEVRAAVIMHQDSGQSPGYPASFQRNSK
jgi:hypothetical protein